MAMEMTISQVSNFEISPGPHVKIRLSHPKAMQGGCSYFTDRLKFISMNASESFRASAMVRAQSQPLGSGPFIRFPKT